MTQRRKLATLNLRIDEALKAQASAAAAADHRSLTSLVEKLLSDYLLERGYLKPAVPPGPAPSTPSDAPIAPTKPRRARKPTPEA